MATARAQALRASVAERRPEAAAIREKIREILKARRGSYRAATNPRTRVQTPYGGSADSHADDMVRRLTRELSRDLDRNAGPFQTINDKIEEFSVGGGVHVRAKSPNAEWNRKATALYSAKMSEVVGGIDARQMRSGFRLQRLIARHLGVDGDVGLLKLADGTAQIIEADQIDGKLPEGVKKAKGSTVRGGAYLDAAGKSLGWIVSPYAQAFAGGIDYGASELCLPSVFHFAALTDRNSQTRGMPKLKAVLDDFERADSYVESEVIAAENGSQVFIKLMYPNGKNPTTPYTPTLAEQNEKQLRGGLDENGLPDWQPTAAGSALVCPDGMIAEGYDPKRPNVNIEAFLIFLLRGYCAAVGYSYEFVFGDLRNMSWSVAKTLVDMSNSATEAFQTSHLGPVFSGMYLWQIRRFIDQGLLPDIKGWDQHEHEWPRMAQPDDSKFFASNLVGFQSGQTSRHRVFGAKAFEIMDELAKERAYACKLAAELTKQYPQFTTLPEHFLGTMPAGGAPVDPSKILNPITGVQEKPAPEPEAPGETPDEVADGNVAASANRPAKKKLNGTHLNGHRHLVTR